MNISAFFSAVALAAVSPGLSAQVQSNGTQELASPSLSASAILCEKVSICPYRVTGIRLAPEYIEGRLVIHNYGHGGAELALSWGSVKEAIDLMELEIITGEFINYSSDIAILGSGVIALTTAHKLMDRGFRVHLYTNFYPPIVVSNTPGAIWWPAAVAVGSSSHDQKLFKKILKNSYNAFKHFAQDSNPAFAGVSNIPLYNFNSRTLPNQDLIESLFPLIGTADVSFTGGSESVGTFYEGLKIDADVYLNDLYFSALERGASIAKISLASKEDIISFSEFVIFNCSGIWSKTLFADPYLIPVKTQEIYLSPQADVDYAASAWMTDMPHPFVMVPFEDKIVLGGIFLPGDATPFIDTSVTEGLLEHARRFFYEAN